MLGVLCEIFCNFATEKIRIYMRNKLVVIMAMSLLPMVVAMGQRYDRWSVIGKVGVNKLRGGEVNQSYGIAGEYGFSPKWSAGCEVMYLLTDRHGTENYHYKTYLLDVYASFNLTNILCESQKKVEVMANVGIGMGMGDWHFNDWKKNFAPMLHVGPAVEWNVSKSIGRGADFRFIISSTNHFMGSEDGKHMVSDVSLNGYYNGNLYSRWKIGSGERRVKHVMNVGPNY